jgi:hypothetical protein
MRERALADKVLPRLRLLGGSWRKNPVSSYGSSGISDIVGCYRGRYVEIELKAPGRYANVKDGLTPLQAKHHLDIELNGGWVIVADDWPTIQRALESFSDTLTDSELGPNGPAGLTRPL